MQELLNDPEELLNLRKQHEEEKGMEKKGLRVSRKGAAKTVASSVSLIQSQASARRLTPLLLWLTVYLDGLYLR